MQVDDFATFRFELNSVLRKNAAVEMPFMKQTTRQRESKSVSKYDSMPKKYFRETHLHDSKYEEKNSRDHIQAFLSMNLKTEDPKNIDFDKFFTQELPPQTKGDIEEYLRTYKQKEVSKESKIPLFQKNAKTKLEKLKNQFPRGLIQRKEY